MLLEERNRSTCKACGKPIVQSGKARKLFCNATCQRRYYKTTSVGQSLTKEWGAYAPETRKILLELQQLHLEGTAKRLAIAIDREYTLRKGKDAHSPVIICVCQTCGKEFRRRPWGYKSKEYCSYRCLPTNKRAKLTWEIVDEIRYLYETEHMSYAELTERFSVSDAAIWPIISYKVWKPERDPRPQDRMQWSYIEHTCKTCGIQFLRRPWVKRSDQDYCSTQCHPPKLLNRYGKNNPSSKVTWEQVDEMRSLYATGRFSTPKLGEKYNLHSSTVLDIVRYKTWKPEHDPRVKQEVNV